jgi:serine/threonine protein kinase
LQKVTAQQSQFLFSLIFPQYLSGGFGVVDLVQDKQTQKELVLKRCNIDRESMYDTVRKEIHILQKFEGPYIVKLLDNDIGRKGNSREALLLMDYYPGGHLLDHLRSRDGQFLPHKTIYRIFGQILMALRPLHEHIPPIVHRDVKLENFLFGSDGKIRMCDFGSCLESPVHLRNVAEREKAEERIQKETTPIYRAPEMVDLYIRDKLTEKTDIWALGCIFYALTFLKHPFQNVGSLGIIGGKYSIPKDSPLNEDGHEFLRRMLDVSTDVYLCVQLLNCIISTD